MTWLWLAVAGGAGACARYRVDALVPRGGGAPRGTVVVNMTACLLLGLLTAVSSVLPSTAVTVLGAGLLGGYSTFSTASVEGARLVLEGRWGVEAAHAAAMTLGTVTCAWLGAALGTAVVAALA